jgi:hypothetical protein
MKGRSSAALAVVAAALLIGLCGALQHVRDTRYPVPESEEASLYITSGTAISHLTSGYHAIAADLYWIRTIQYYGGLKREVAGSPAKAAAVDYHLLYPLLDLTTTLDPRFNIAYRFGAIFLAEAPPAGPGRPDLAIALLEKGLRAVPDKWEYMQDIGFVHYWWRHDYRAAAEWFTRAADVPGAPWWLRSLAATTLAEGGDRRQSRLVWKAILDSAEIDWLRGDAERRLMQLDALDELDAVQAVVDRFMAATHTTPSGWGPLVAAGALRGIPVDPSRTPLELDASGRVRVSVDSPLFPLPEEPKALPPA